VHSEWEQVPPPLEELEVDELELVEVLLDELEVEVLVEELELEELPEPVTMQLPALLENSCCTV
jgi:hypothetical protein